MGLIVFDMGRRVETPVQTPRRRVRPLSAAEPVSPIEHNTDQPHDQQGLVYSSQGTPEKSSHTPQPVAYNAQIMERSFITVRSDTPVSDALALMREHGIHHLPVVDAQESLQAMVSDRRILRALVEGDSKEHDPVLAVAARPVYCTGETTDIRQTARLLSDYHIGALPVLNEEEQLTGIITRSDLLRLISEYGPLELWA